MNNSYNALRNITSFRNTGKSQPISGIELMVDEKNMYFAGNDNGYVMTIDCPYGTQQMANDLLAKAKGFEYQGYTAEQVVLPPEAELGDGINVAGIYGMIARRSFKFTPGMTSNIEAPRELEVQHEYKYTSPQQRKIERQIAETKSSITKTASEIELKIEGLDGQYTSLKLSVDNLTSTVSGKIDGSQAQTLIDQSIDKIELSVSSNNGGSTFTLKAGNTTLSTDTLDLHVKAVNVDGTLKASQIQTNGIYVGDLADGSSYATKTYVNSNAGLSESEVNSAIATYIDETSITAETLRGRYIDLLASDNSPVGSIELVYTTTGYGMAIKTDNGGIKLQSGGNIYLESSSGAFVQITDSVYLGGGTLKIGSASYGSRLPSNPEYGQLFFLRD